AIVYLASVAGKVWVLLRGKEVVACLTCSQTLEITTEPSPTAEATRFTDPARTSPTAKMPGQEVANGETGWPKPVTTNPLSSSFTKPDSHSVFGTAPTIMNSARAPTGRDCPVAELRMVTLSRCSPPSSAATSELYSIAIPGSASR